MHDAVAQRQRGRLVPVLARRHAGFLADRKPKLGQHRTLDLGDRELVDGLGGCLRMRRMFLHCELLKRCPGGMIRRALRHRNPGATARYAEVLCKDWADSASVGESRSVI